MHNLEMQEEKPIYTVLFSPTEDGFEMEVLHQDRMQRILPLSVYLDGKKLKKGKCTKGKEECLGKLKVGVHRVVQRVRMKTECFLESTDQLPARLHVTIPPAGGVTCSLAGKQFLTQSEAPAQEQDQDQ